MGSVIPVSKQRVERPMYTKGIYTVESQGHIKNRYTVNMLTIFRRLPNNYLIATNIINYSALSELYRSIRLLEI